MVAQQHLDEYKISTMHCGGNSFVIVHEVHRYYQLEFRTPQQSIQEANQISDVDYVTSCLTSCHWNILSRVSSRHQHADSAQGWYNNNLKIVFHNERVYAY